MTDLIAIFQTNLLLVYVFCRCKCKSINLKEVRRRYKSSKLQQLFYSLHKENASNKKSCTRMIHNLFLLNLRILLIFAVLQIIRLDILQIKCEHSLLDVKALIFFIFNKI